MPRPPAPPTTCADCGGPLVSGSLVDYRRNLAEAAEWVPGEVESSRWTGALKNTGRRVITAYRCDDCGLLRLYAIQPAERPGNVSSL